MKEKFKEWGKTLVVVCIWLFMGVLGSELGLVQESIVLPTTVGGVIGYLIAKDIRREKTNK